MKFNKEEVTISLMETSVLAAVQLQDGVPVPHLGEGEHQRSKLVNIMDDTTKGNLNTLFKQQIQAAKRKKDDFEALFQSPEKPDVSGAIT